MSPGKVYTTGDPTKLLWVIAELPEAEFLCIAQMGTARNRPIYKVFKTRLTANTRRAEIDEEDAREFRAKCTNHVVAALNDLISKKAIRALILKDWTFIKGSAL